MPGHHMQALAEGNDRRKGRLRVERNKKTRYAGNIYIYIYKEMSVKERKRVKIYLADAHQDQRL